jgi:hypothetical protein
MGAKELYDVDFFEWAQQNAELLRRGCFDAADIQHIAEELGDMGNRDQREVQSYLTRLVMHLLKWQFQPSQRTTSWERSILNSRFRLERIFEQSPSLRRLASESIAKIYSHARRAAVVETRLAKEAFLPECPYTFDQLLDADYLPNS